MALARPLPDVTFIFVTRSTVYMVARLLWTVSCGMHRDGSQQEVVCTKDERGKWRSGQLVYPFVVGKY